MSFTAKDVIDDVRVLVNDADQSTWPDPTFVPFVNEAVRLLHSERPECRLDNDGALAELSEVEDASDTVPLDDLYRNAVAEYLAYRYFDADAGDTRDKARAAEHLERFDGLLGPLK